MQLFSHAFLRQGRKLGVGFGTAGYGRHRSNGLSHTFQTCVHVKLLRDHLKGFF